MARSTSRMRCIATSRRRARSTTSWSTSASSSAPSGTIWCRSRNTPPRRSRSRARRPLRARSTTACRISNARTSWCRRSRRRRACAMRSSMPRSRWSMPGSRPTARRRPPPERRRRSHLPCLSWLEVGSARLRLTSACAQTAIGKTSVFKLRPAVVLESQHLDSFDLKGPDSPKNTAIVASFAFSRVFAGCYVSYIKRGRGYGENKVAIGRAAADRRGGVRLKGATDEKVHLNCSGRRRACDAGTGGRYEGQAGSAAGAAESVGRRLWRRHHLGLHLPRHHPIQSQAVGRRLFRAALQRHQGPAILCGHLEREYLVSEPRGCRGRHLRRVPSHLGAAPARLPGLVLLVL